MQQDQILLALFILMGMIIPGLAILFDDSRFRGK
jgi:hypothetical protein